MVKSAIVTGKALLTSTSLAMRGTCNCLIVLGSFSDGLSAEGAIPSRVHRSRIGLGRLREELSAQVDSREPRAPSDRRHCLEVHLAERSRCNDIGMPAHKGLRCDHT